MKQLSLKVESRNASGRCASHAQRAAGKVPAVMYGKSAPRGLMIDSKTFAGLYKEIAGITALINVEDEKGAKHLALVQEVQRHRLTDAFVHIDLKEVKDNEQMRARLRVRTHGESFGAKNEGALLEVVYSQLTISCLPKDLPQFIEIDVTELKAGEAIFVKDLKAVAGVKFLDKADQVVITCNVPEVEEEKAPETPVAGAEGAAAAVGADGKPVAPAVGADGKPVAAAAPAAGKDAKAAAPAKDAKPAAKK